SYVITSGTPRNSDEHVFCIQQSAISTQATTQTTTQTTSTAQTTTQTTQGLKGCRSNFTYSTNTSTCLWFSGDPGKSASYAKRDKAALNCQAMGAHLVTAKTLAKLKYLEATYYIIFWVGLRYDSTSQVYVWDEDGSSLTIETHNNIFSILCSCSAAILVKPILDSSVDIQAVTKTSAVTVMRCAMKCLSQRDTCQAFTYNNVTTNCILGSTITWVPTRRINDRVFKMFAENKTFAPTTQTASTSQTTTKTTSPILTLLLETTTNQMSSARNQSGQIVNTCSTNFTLSANTSTCLWFSGTINRTDRIIAALECRAKGAYLASITSLAKLQYVNVTYSPSMWVGLSFNSTMNIYVWDEDGSELSNATYGNLFASGQPYPPTYDCVSLNLKLKEMRLMCGCASAVQFQFLPDTSNDIRPVTETLTTSTALRCGMKCLLQGDNCQAFSYDDVTTTCVLAKGAHLVTVKTQAKLQSLTVVYSPLVWVGLLYNKTSKVYLWDEDGSIMTNATYKELFGFAADLISSPQVDVCVYATWLNTLEDIMCDSDNFYICEHQPF
ncbi:hypothetical protein Bpfe_010614, partial [Biomphalaria pfeifferi]